MILRQWLARPIEYPSLHFAAMQIRSITAAVVTARWRRIAVVGVLVAGVLIWWWYPTISNESSKTDVAIVGDSFLHNAEHELTDRIHENGFSLDWAVGGGPKNATEATAAVTNPPAGPESTWCDAPDLVRSEVQRVDPSIIVVSFASEGTCGTDPVAVRAAVAIAAGSARLIVVTNPATEDSSPDPPHAVVVRTSLLLGPDATMQQTCLWFDACPPDGQIDVRDASDNLVISGQTRVARMIVAALR